MPIFGRQTVTLIYGSAGACDYDRVLSQADCVAANLANVSGIAAIALQRR